MTKLNIVVVGHKSRKLMAKGLSYHLGASLFLDYSTNGAAWNHRRALEWGATKEGHLVIVEDDALPVEDFREKAADWIERFPDDLISFYLGTGHPMDWMRKVDWRLQEGDDHIRLSQLIHGVCYALPCASIPLAAMKPNEPADYGLGNAWMKKRGKQIVYPVRSLVDHRDSPSIESPHSLKPRHARRLDGLIALHSDS